MLDVENIAGTGPPRPPPPPRVPPPLHIDADLQNV